jgi:ABC-type nickel/cobalt efflux system permease component RcnA
MGGADMLNEERIRLMTKMASYEEGEGKEYMPIKQYYRKDYVGLGMIKTFITSSIAFGILLLCWVLYDMDNITNILSTKDLTEFGTFVLVIYIIFIAVYQVIALGVYNWRYSRAAASIKGYHSVMKKVEKLQEREERSLPLED